MDLRNTAEMMLSSDYKERFRAEYYQTKIRYEKLHRMTIQYEAGTLNFTAVLFFGSFERAKSGYGELSPCTRSPCRNRKH